MIKRAVSGLMLAAFLSGTALGAGDAQRGARAFQACAACHSLEPGRHMTGPSLAGLWGRKAASQSDFRRYSEAMKRSDIVWTEGTLDKWLANPESSVPGNFMVFEGMRDEKARADLIAFLRASAEGKSPTVRQAPAFPDLKKTPPQAVITAIRHCKDTYYITDGKEETRPYWEFNLRFKTDSGASGPAAGRPVLVGQGMRGDRAQVVFANPAEISTFIREGC